MNSTIKMSVSSVKMSSLITDVLRAFCCSYVFFVSCYSITVIVNLLLFWMLLHLLFRFLYPPLIIRFHQSSWVWRTLWLSRPPPPPTCPPLPRALPTTLVLALLFLTPFLQLPPSLSPPTPTTMPPSLKRLITPWSSLTFRWPTSPRRNRVQ